MVVYFMLFAVMWKYAPTEEEEGEEEDETGPCCSLLSGTAAQGAGAGAGVADGESFHRYWCVRLYFL